VVETVSPRPGTDVTWRVGLARAPLPHGEPGLVAVVDDVSELVRADRVRQLNQLARIVAHEVKNPLTPIRLWVQELEAARRAGSGDLGALVEEACGEIGAQVERLQETASSFSNLVALERWEPVAVDLAELVPAAVAGLAVLKRRGVEVELDLPPAGSCRVTGDATWLRRALGNLVHNSVTAIGDGPGAVHVRVAASDGWALLEVEDSGGGVADSSLDSLFSPHFSTTTGGSGLGLALVANVVARCHGRVSAANGAAGLVVRLELPLAAVAGP
jgi:signal transduction histidine kinase